MSNQGGESTGVTRRSQAVKEAWKRTNDDMAAMADQRREAGWTVASMPAVHTSPVGADQGDDDRFGLVHVIPDNHADDFVEAFERGEFARFEAYRNEVGSYSFFVTELIDEETETAIYVAANYDLRLAGGLVRSVLDADAIYTHAETLDGTTLGSVRHEDYDPLLPDLEQLRGLVPGTVPDPDET